MSVLKGKRKASYFEVEHNALEMRRIVTELCIRKFGYKMREIGKEPRNFEQWSQGSKTRWYEERMKQIQFAELFDTWFITDERQAVVHILREIISLISRANALYPSNMAEYEQRRLWQDEAIGLCHSLKQELQYVAETIPTDVNWLTATTEPIDREIALLKGWRKSDNHFKDQLNKNTGNV